MSAPPQYKPLEIKTVRPRWTPAKIALVVVYLTAIAAVVFDLFVWRP